MAKHQKSNELPLYLFHQGTNSHAYQLLGAHWLNENTVVFRVWAPHAKAVSVIGSFNDWNEENTEMTKITEQGVWEATVCGAKQYDIYKYRITTSSGAVLDKSDPYAFHAETRPSNASKLFCLKGYEWSDSKWLQKRKQTVLTSSPINIYEVHLGSWKTHEDGQVLGYRQLAEQLVPYVKEMGYTHLEILPVTEHPFDGSWGYQVTGYFAPTSRYGTPHDFMYFVDACHQADIGVIMDWVPAHFPKDAYGLCRFDGEPCYEYSDPHKGEHKEWGTYAFDYGRNEVISFLSSSAMYWIKEYHIDGIRVDAVASMLYLDYGRSEGQWIPNIHGGRENLEAVALLRQINKSVLTEFPDTMMIAEESTSWPMVTKPDYSGGLGFSFKWNMGWMNDSLAYVSMDPYFRSYNHDKLTFSMFYAFSENFVLPISHDEVVHGKCSLLNKMPGNYEQKFAGLRTFLGYMMAFPGKKLLFMGSEFGQFIEWDFQKQLDWLLLDYPIHRQTQTYVRALNHFYLEHSELWQIENSWDGYRWLNADDNTRSTISFLRVNEKGEQVAVICNFAPVEWTNYLVGLPEDCTSVQTVLCSEWQEFGGTLPHVQQTYRTKAGRCGEFNRVISLTVPPLSVTYLKLRHKKPIELKKSKKTKSS